MKAEISALVDGELEPDSVDRVVDAMRLDPELHARWETYHAIGDALRHTPALQADFSRAIVARMASEPVVLAPAALSVRRHSPLRMALPLAAAITGVGAVAWVALSVNGQQGERLAAIQSTTLPTATTAPSLATQKLPQGALKEYLVAHQAYAPNNRIQGVAPAVRTVSEIRQGARQ